MMFGLAGHVDHGKTALVFALTGIDTDRLPEEKRRGMTIDVGFAYHLMPDGTTVGFVDVPGHERFLPNLLSGIVNMRRVLLVVAADDGPMVQTFEHLAIIKLLEVQHVIAVITKIDKVDADRLSAVAVEVAALLQSTGYGGEPIAAVSSLSGQGIAELRDRLLVDAGLAEQRSLPDEADRGFPPLHRPHVYSAWGWNDSHRLGRCGLGPCQ